MFKHSLHSVFINLCAMIFMLLYVSTKSLIGRVKRDPPNHLGLDLLASEQSERDSVQYVPLENSFLFDKIY